MTGFQILEFLKNQKLNKMTSNVNGTSIMIHMRLTACRLDTCATSGRCYTSDLWIYQNFILFFYLITVMLFVQIELLVNRDPQTGYRPVKNSQG